MGAENVYLSQVAFRGITSAALIVLVAGCGGGTGTAGGVASAVGGSSVTTANITVTSKYTYPTMRLLPEKDQTLTAAYTIKYGADGDPKVVPATQGMTIVFDKAAGTYTVSTPLDGAGDKFLPAERSTTTSDGEIYSHSTGAGTSVLRLYRGRFSLMYAVIGDWYAIGATTATTPVRQFVTGASTYADDVPAGNATWAMKLEGQATNRKTGVVMNLDSTSIITMTADFRAGTVNTNLTLVGAPAIALQPTVDFGKWAGSGNITSGTTSYAGTLSGSMGEGSFAGGFFGPQALETGYVWSVSGPDMKATGVAAGMRELMAVDTQALPPEVQRAVRFYTANLASRRAFGGSVEVALAPDSNINHATRAETLGTVLGDFVLDANARARSGTGLSLRGSVMARTGIDAQARLLVQVSGRLLTYRDGAFNDHEVTVQAGPEYSGANGRLVLGATAGARWYGNALYTTSYGVNAQWQRSLGARSQMRAEAEIAQIDHRFNAWQSGIGYGVSLGLDRSFSPRLGAGVQVSANRRMARDAAYATTGGGVTAFAWRELGHTTLVARMGHDRLKADAAAFLLPHARSDRRLAGSIAATFRALRVGTFAPIARVSYERNRSTVALFEYRRLAGEMGITAAF